MSEKPFEETGRPVFFKLKNGEMKFKGEEIVIKFHRYSARILRKVSGFSR